MADWALITGASRGIGLQAAARFRQAGWRVMNISRRPCSVQGVLNVEADLSAAGWEEKVEAALRDAVGPGGGRLSLVHNAALYEQDSALDLTAEHLRRVLEVNIVAPSQLNRLVRSRLTPGSSILYVGSTLSEKGVKGVASYTTSKHALVGLMRATCQDLVGMQVHTACICPGFTDTEMLREHIGDNPAVVASVAGRTTFGRLIAPSEIADVLYFCATTPVFNGAVLHAHLGQLES